MRRTSGAAARVARRPVHCSSASTSTTTAWIASQAWPAPVSGSAPLHHKARQAGRPPQVAHGHQAHQRARRGLTPRHPRGGQPIPDLATARRAVELVLKGHEPNPALAVDRHWNLVAANAVVPLLLAGVAPHLLAPPVNVLRLSLHPEGLGPRLANAGHWRAHLLHRLQQQFAATADAQLQALHGEIAAYPPAASQAPWDEAMQAGDIVVPFRLHTAQGLLSFISTTTIFGTPVDVTLQELAVESFFPADSDTQASLQRLRMQAGS